MDDHSYRDGIYARVDTMLQDAISQDQAVRRRPGYCLILARRLLRDLEASDPDLIEGWLHEQRLVFLSRVFIERRDRF